MLRKGHVIVIAIVGIILALAFAYWALKGLSGEPQGDLMRAAFDGDMFMLKAIVDAGGDVNTVTPEGWTALMYAATGNSLEATRYLIDNGADINARNDNGKTALTLAKEAQFDAVAKLLQDEGAIE